MAGYYNYSMSNNAVSAYADGEKPLSKWTKSEIIETLVSEGVSSEKIDLIKKLSAKAVKYHCLRRSSWHHTSSHYNKTDFYEVFPDFVESESIEIIKGWLVSDQKEKESLKSKPIPQPKKAKVVYLEWGGTRKHPKAKEITAIGEITADGKWFIEGGCCNKHSTSARGFKVLEILS